MAIETQGFTFVTSGRKRESLTVSTFKSTAEEILDIEEELINFRRTSLFITFSLVNENLKEVVLLF